MINKILPLILPGILMGCLITFGISLIVGINNVADEREAENAKIRNVHYQDKVFQLNNLEFGTNKVTGYDPTTGNQITISGQFYIN